MEALILCSSFRAHSLYLNATENTQNTKPVCGGLTLAGSGCPTLCSLSASPQQDEGQNKVEKVMDQGKEKEITCQSASEAKQTQLGKK